MRSSGGKESRTKLFATVFITTLFGLVSFFTLRFLVVLKMPVGRNFVLEIKKGEPAANFILKLKPNASQEVLFFVKLYLKLTGAEHQIKPCRIVVTADETLIGVIKRVVYYTPPSIKLVIYEGMDSFEIHDLLKKEGFSEADNFLKIVSEKKLEGFLFPDTYFVTQDFPANALIYSMLQNFNKRALKLLKKAKILPPYKTLILASIIQKETYSKSEMPLIASVFYNRLRRGMPLQADPTVIYALKLKLGKNVVRPLTIRDLKIDSPYNTYLRKGLPPTPICNPGISAIKAAVWPARTKYLYFVSKGDGTHVFARTLREHLKNIAKYRKRK